MECKKSACVVGAFIVDWVGSFPRGVFWAYSETEYPEAFAAGEGVHLKEVATNRFTIHFNHKLDYSQALEGTPWLVDKHALLHLPYNGEGDPKELPINMIPIVVRLNNIPSPYRNPEVAEKLCNAIREF